MSDLYITITGFQHYYGKTPFKIGNLIRCAKEPDNAFDAETIRCFLPMIGTVGYVANSTGTVAGGTHSAGRLYDRVPERFYVRVCFTTATKVICKVELGVPVKRLNEELDCQMERDGDRSNEGVLLIQEGMRQRRLPGVSRRRRGSFLCPPPPHQREEEGIGWRV